MNNALVYIFALDDYRCGKRDRAIISQLTEFGVLTWKLSFELETVLIRD